MLRRWSHQFRNAAYAACHLGLFSGVLTACASTTQTRAEAPGAPAAERAPRAPLPRDIVATSALPLHGLEGESRLSEPDLWQRMSNYRVVCLGEQHDSPEHHYAQRRAIEELAARSAAQKRPLAIGFEMFQTPYQPALTGFVTGALPEEQFLVESEYATRWGFDFALYRPLLDLARGHELPALALNAPRELTRKIGRSGLAALDDTDRKQLPELDLNVADHRAYFDKAMEHHPAVPGGPSFDDMYAVQVVWDETMADTAVRWLEAAGPTSQVVVLAGAGHCHKSAIPGRIARRLNTQVLGVSAVLESKLGELEGRDRYDWLLVLEDGAKND